MDNKKVNDLKKYIDEMIKNSENISNEKLAKILGYEKHYVSKKFREIIGETFQEYVKKRKIQLATYDIINTKENIINIAEKYGYCADGFTKAFKNIHGITPMQYRKNEFLHKDYTKIIDNDYEFFALESCRIHYTDKLTFIGLSIEASDFNMEFDTECSYLEEEFKILSMLSGNDKYYQISYKSKEKTEYMLANYYNPLESLPSEFEIKVISKQKWLILSGRGANFNMTLYYLKKYVSDIWLPMQKEYELDDNYEIAFEKHNYDYDNLSDYEKCTTWVEIWIPIRKKKI